MIKLNGPIFLNQKQVQTYSTKFVVHSATRSSYHPTLLIPLCHATNYIHISTFVGRSNLKSHKNHFVYPHFPQIYFILQTKTSRSSLHVHVYAIYILTTSKLRRLVSIKDLREIPFYNPSSGVLYLCISLAPNWVLAQIQTHPFFLGNEHDSKGQKHQLKFEPLSPKRECAQHTASASVRGSEQTVRSNTILMSGPYGHPFSPLTVQTWFRDWIILSNRKVEKALI